MGAADAPPQKRAFANRTCTRAGAQSAHGGLFEALASDPLMQGSPRMAHLILAVSLDIARKRSLGDLTDGRPQLANWMRRIADLPGMRATAMP